MERFHVKKWAGIGGFGGERLIIGWKKTRTNHPIKTLKSVDLRGK
jgi:hypothetical protein